MPDLGFACYSGFSEIFKPHLIENILPGRQTLELQL